MGTQTCSMCLDHLSLEMVIYLWYRMSSIVRGVGESGRDGKVELFNVEL